MNVSEVDLLEVLAFSVRRKNQSPLRFSTRVDRDVHLLRGIVDQDV
jgi:hypothetical protein